MSFDIGKKKLEQGQEQAGGKDEINYHGVDVRNSTCGLTMISSDKANQIGNGAVDVGFGIGNISSRYASKMRSDSPDLSEASSSTLRDDTPEPVAESNSVSTSFVALNAQSHSAPLLTSPSTPVTPTKKRLREEGTSSELLWTDRETFNSAKRHTGAPVASSRSEHVNSSPLRPQIVPQAAAVKQRVPLHGLRTHPSESPIGSPPLPIRLSAPRAVTNTLRQTSLHVTSSEVINLDDEDSPDFRPFRLPAGAEVIDLDDYEGEAALEEEIFGIEPQSLIQDNIRRVSLAKRNPEILPPHVEVGSLAWKSSLLKPGKTVELKNGTFLKIKSIVKNLTSDEVSIRGWKLVRTRDFVLGGMARKKRNEVAFIHETDNDDKRDLWEQSVHKIHVDEIVKIRRLICTNRPFPDCRYDKEDIPWEITIKEPKEIKKYVEDEMVLVARWAFVVRFSDAEARVRNSSVVDRPPKSAILRSLESKEECTKGEFVEPDVRKMLWRGESVLGGSGNLSNGGGPSQTSSKYTYGDGYCGAGGMTVGAAASGLKVKWGFDFNPHAGLTWEKNFPYANFHLLPVNEFTALPDPNQDLWVDILHLSPPCQVFSPVHTVPGQNDAMNFASLFGVGEAIKKARPRIVTLEQTFGILHPSHKEAFNGLISCFTDLGFNVSWQVVKFQGYGTPSRRTRLIILASCPGEPLPHMPQYTYTDPLLSTPTKKPYRTPNQALSSIPPHAPNHDPHNPALNRSNYIPWDGSVVCGCILTSGGIGLGLPNGSRGMTNRELAALQSFPLKHVFHGQEVRKQVGNAVPPVFAKIMLGSLRRQLERRDGWVRGEGIVISSDEE